MIYSNCEIFFNAVFSGNNIWQHSKRVAILAKKVAYELGFNSVTREQIFYAAQYHDIGKIYGNTTEHPDQGYFLFLRLNSDHAVAELIRHHHCNSKQYHKRYNEFDRGFPQETCRLLDVLSPSLQVLQICNEWDNFQQRGKSAKHEIEFLLENQKWDYSLGSQVLRILS